MKTKQIAKAAGFIACLTVGVFIGLLANPLYQIGASLLVGRTVQTLNSPDGKHTAALLRKHNLADFTFLVKVNGKRVYISPDLIGFPDSVYRETLVWDKTGRVVVLELMGKRVFAYDTLDERTLSKGELQQYKLYPMPDDYFYVYLKDIDD
jgi:hypothetical protein